MSVYDIWPAFACMALLLLLARTPVFARAGFASNGTRVNSIDGLRGFLALGVALHHSVIYYEFLRIGRWHTPPSQFYALLGQVSVSFFFVITGYLFWGKIIRAKGFVDFPKLMMGRFFRLGPVYLLTIGLAVFIAFYRAGGQLNVAPEAYLLQVVNNLALDFFPLVDMNDDKGSYTIVAGVTWTLRYEWYFYFALPVLALFARKNGTHLPFAIFLAIFCIVFALLSAITDWTLFTLFALGMVCASLEFEKALLKLPPAALSSIGIAILILIFWTCSTAYQPGVALLVGVAFYLLVCGASLFGLLNAKPSVRLGDISYGIYLLQGLALYFAFAIGPVRRFALMSDAGYWVVVFGTLTLLVAVALVVHVFIERPGVQLGKSVDLRVNATG
jgi:peptidoglycan/LPS O-acetylase OafA/YrhL